jgi:hypothetical protein
MIVLPDANVLHQEINGCAQEVCNAHWSGAMSSDKLLQAETRDHAPESINPME